MEGGVIKQPFQKKGQKSEWQMADGASVCDPENETVNAGGDDPPASEETGECVDFRVVWKKNNYNVNFPVDQKAIKLKHHIETLTGIPPSMMKLMYKGIVKDDVTLREMKVTHGAKMMVIGSTMGDVVTVQMSKQNADLDKAESAAEPKELLCEQKEHAKIIEKGKPEDAIVGIKNAHDRLPPDLSLSGMVNKQGAKVRLHFKRELDQVWIGTKERTQKVPLGSIKTIVSEPIKGHEDYHIMGFQLGTTELSRYWVYWVPAQYVEAIKDMILGKWMYF